MNPNRSRSTIIYVLLFAAIIILVFYSFNQSSSTQETLSINQVAADVQSGKITRIVEEQDKLTVIYGTGTQAIERIAHKEPETTLVQQLKDLGVVADQLSPDHISIEFKPLVGDCLIIRVYPSVCHPWWCILVCIPSSAG